MISLFFFPGYAYITENELCLDTIDEWDWKLFHANLGEWKDVGNSMGVNCVNDAKMSQLQNVSYRSGGKKYRMELEASSLPKERKQRLFFAH